MKLIKNSQHKTINVIFDLNIENDDYILVGNEIDATSSYILEVYKSTWYFNYAMVKDCYQYLGKSFNSLSDNDKQKVVEYCAISQNDCISYYRSIGMSLSAATQIYIENRANDIVQLAQVCQNNAKNSNILKVLLKYLLQANCEKFLVETKDLIFYYSNYAIYGKKYGNSISGILDFVEDFGDYNGTGLSTYTLYNGVLADLVSELKTVLTNNRCNYDLF